MCKQPGNYRIVVRMLAAMALSATSLLNHAACAEVPVQVVQSPPPGTEWKQPQWDGQQITQDFGQRANPPGLGYPHTQRGRLGSPAYRWNNNNPSPTFGYLDKCPRQASDMLDSRPAGARQSRYRRGRPGYGPRHGGYGYGYPGYRGHGGNSYPRHRAYGTPPIHLSRELNQKTD